MFDKTEELTSVAREAIGDLTPAEVKLIQAIANSQTASYRIHEYDDPSLAYNWGDERRSTRRLAHPPRSARKRRRRPARHDRPAGRVSQERAQIIELRN